jgi:hypothetical protein
MKKFEVNSICVYNVFAESKEEAKWAVENGEHNKDVARCYVGRVDQLEEFDYEKE